VWRTYWKRRCTPAASREMCNWQVLQRTDSRNTQWLPATYSKLSTFTNYRKVLPHCNVSVLFVKQSTDPIQCLLMTSDAHRTASCKNMTIGITHLTISRRLEGWVDLRWFACLQMVTHPSSNQARCRVTTLIEPLSHVTTSHCLITQYKLVDNSHTVEAVKTFSCIPRTKWHHGTLTVWPNSTQ